MKKTLSSLIVFYLFIDGIVRAINAEIKLAKRNVGVAACCGALLFLFLISFWLLLIAMLVNGLYDWLASWEAALAITAGINLILIIIIGLVMRQRAKKSTFPTRLRKLGREMYAEFVRRKTSD